MVIPYRTLKLLENFVSRAEDMLSHPNYTLVSDLMKEAVTFYPGIRTYVKAECLNVEKRFTAEALKADLEDFIAGITRAMYLSKSEMEQKAMTVDKKKVDIGFYSKKSTDLSKDPLLEKPADYARVSTLQPVVLNIRSKEEKLNEDAENARLEEEKRIKLEEERKLRENKLKMTTQRTSFFDLFKKKKKSVGNVQKKKIELTLSDVGSQDIEKSIDPVIDRTIAPLIVEKEAPILKKQDEEE